MGQEDSQQIQGWSVIRLVPSRAIGCSHQLRDASCLTVTPASGALGSSVLLTGRIHWPWVLVKTHGIPCCSHQYSWALWMFISPNFDEKPF